MGFLEWMRGGRRAAGTSSRAIGSRSVNIFDTGGLICDAGEEFAVREVVFSACVNMVANYMAKAEMHFFKGEQEERGGEYYLWNVSPNRNQSASEFWHEFVDRLYRGNEVLIIDEPYGDGFVLAEAFVRDDSKPATVFRDVVYRDDRRAMLREGQVMHFQLNNRDIAAMTEAMQISFVRLISAAVNNYVFNSGQHWKVIVDAIAPNQEERIDALQKVIERQIKPFLEANNGVLPQYDGYVYEQVSGAKGSSGGNKDVGELINQVWEQTAMAFGIPTVLIQGKVADDKTAMTRFLSGPIDALARQVEQEANRKRIRRERYLNGDRLVLDTSNMIHYDIMENASNLQALIGSAVYSVNDILRGIGKAPIHADWADKHYLTLNIGQSPIEDGPAEE